ncbi:GAF and ANTAR domain-containing protein [Arthrobacter gandavensis]|uniref:GAF and ANTAR domain-containing protein n=1 Tax=Arthrobacter gandavensis TaxID=169960 RepID=UPI0018903B84|nr:GAF and ANTAR domain-containing protein [Arthrobacter gandavensis]MBF4993082.1 GAF and ANTAR domain-containing protein [Arthrobacter gandavensis]
MTEVPVEPAAAFQELLLGAEELEAYLSELAVLTLTLLGARILGCSLLIDRPRRLRAEGHSDDRSAGIAGQVFAAEGPAEEAISTGASVVVPDVWSERRWHGFSGEGADEGLRSLAAVPLALEGAARGVLCAFSPRPHLFQPSTLRLVEKTAAEASRTLRLALRIDNHLFRARNLRAALESRTVVNIAVGIIMAQNNCSQDAAVEILRSVSNTRNIKIHSVAAGIVAAVSDRVRTHFEE